MEKQKQKIIPHLWFDKQAEEAAEFYASTFRNAKVGERTHYTDAGQEMHKQPEGAVMTVDFWLEGHRFVGLNGGPVFKFNSSISFFVLCKSENEIQGLWEHFMDGGKALMPLDSYDWSAKYAWLQDKYGLNWQLMLEKEAPIEQKIVPLFFFSGDIRGKAEESIGFYTSVFKNSQIDHISFYGNEETFTKNTVMHASFTLEGQKFMAMDSAMENEYPFNEAISHLVICEDQEEIDYYWERLTKGGDPAAQQCGWLKDKYGVSWQIVPAGLDNIIRDPDKEKANRAMEALFEMKKIEIKQLQDAFEG